MKFTNRFSFFTHFVVALHSLDSTYWSLPTQH